MLYSFSMPDVSSIGLGGGSRVRIKTHKEDHSPVITVGPEWVYFLTNFLHVSEFSVHLLLKVQLVINY